MEHKAYLAEVVFLEVEIRERVIKEMKERKTSFKNTVNSIIREYFEIRAILEGRKSGCNNM